MPDDAGGVVGHGGRRWACELRPGTRPAEPEAAWDPPSASARPHLEEWSDRIPAAHAGRVQLCRDLSLKHGRVDEEEEEEVVGDLPPTCALRRASSTHGRDHFYPLPCLRTTVRVDNASWAR